MADKKPRVERERLGRPVDELVTGRAPGTGERPGDYTAGEVARGTAGAAPTPRTTATSTSPSRDEKPETRTRELRAEIERTREDMSETVDAIQDRLRPGNIAANAAESIRETASDATRDLVESEPVMYVRANPIPIAMIGAGLAWLAFGGRDAKEARYRSRNPLGQYSEGYRGYAGHVDEPYRRGGSARFDRGVSGAYDPDASEGMAERLGDVADDVRDRAGDAARRARRGAVRAQTTLQRTWDDNPLLIGAASAVLGALIGMAVPETDVENEWMGEHRDDMVEGVQQAVREKVDEVQHAATDAANQVKEAVGIKDEG
jgi:hypothetical protein